MSKPLFETHRYGDRRTIVRRFFKGQQIHLLAHHGTTTDRATVFNVDCDVKVTEEFTKVGPGDAVWSVVQVHTGPGDVVDADLPRETRAPDDVPIAKLRPLSWWARIKAWFLIEEA